MNLCGIPVGPDMEDVSYVIGSQENGSKLPYLVFFFFFSYSIFFELVHCVGIEI